jgi:hypothetical protein
MMRRCLRLLVPLMVPALGLSACGAGSGVGDAGSPSTTVPVVTSPVATLPTAPGTSVPPNEAPQPTEVPNRADLVGAGVVAPAALVPDPTDGRVVHVQFWAGPPDCTAARVAVTESASRVIVRLELGSAPGAGAMVCRAIAQFQQITVRLGAPLGARSLVADG